MTDLDILAPDFVEAAHTLVYCSVSTVDPAGRPRSRVMHPIWEWDGRRLTGWLASTPSPKMAHLAERPYVSCAYHDGWAVAVVADSRIEPDHRRRRTHPRLGAVPGDAAAAGLRPGGDRRTRLGRAHRAGIRGGPDGPVAGAGPPGPARRRGGAADVAGRRGAAVGGSCGQPPARDGWLSPMGRAPRRRHCSRCRTDRHRGGPHDRHRRGHRRADHRDRPQRRRHRDDVRARWTPSRPSPRSPSSASGPATAGSVARTTARRSRTSTPPATRTPHAPRRSPSTPASPRSCSAPTPVRTRPSTCCTRWPRA